ncbi:MAG: TIGR00282 family metallophosphoesterase [Planctomycetota bacterium]
MALKIAILGDIVGTAGRQALVSAMPALREEWGAHLVVANAENAANGSGISPEIYRKLKDAGVDGITLGDHAFRKQQIYATLGSQPDIIRPLNLPEKARGRGCMTLEAKDDQGQAVSVHVVTLIGQLFMTNMRGSDAFSAVDEQLARLRARRDADPGVVLVEMHAEATSEKVAMGWHLNGRAACVFGTHTHVPTADARLLPKPGEDPTLPGEPWLGVGQTAYITDLGMTGPYDSVLGRQADRVVKHLTTGMPAAFDVAEGGSRVCGVLVTINPASGLSTAVERIDIAIALNRSQ